MQLLLVLWNNCKETFLLFKCVTNTLYIKKNRSSCEQSSIDIVQHDTSSYLFIYDKQCQLKLYFDLWSL